MVRVWLRDRFPKPFSEAVGVTKKRTSGGIVVLPLDGCQQRVTVAAAYSDMHVADQQSQMV